VSNQSRPFGTKLVIKGDIAEIELPGKH
jgi:hypothetical protein